MENDYHESRLQTIEAKVLEMRERGVPCKWIAQVLKVPWASVIAITNRQPEGGENAES